MTTRARQGLGWALLGLVLWLIAALVSIEGGASANVWAGLVVGLVALAGVVLVIGGLAVTAVSLIRR